MGRIQVTPRHKVHTTPLGASRWDGVVGVHPMGHKGLVGHLRPRLLSNVNYSPPQR